MQSSAFDLEEKRLKKEIRTRKAKLVLIQLPEGLKSIAPRLATVAEKAGALAVVLADPCYGSCGLATVEAEKLGADLVVHYGHTEMVTPPATATVYIEAKSKASVKSAVKEALPHLARWRKIGLTTTVQHAHKLDEARIVLLEDNKAVMVGNAGRLKYAGQISGCDYANAKAISKEVDAFLFVGGGRFHAIGLSLATMKPVVVADPYERKAFTLEDEVQRTLRRRWASIHEAKKAKNIGVLVGLRVGQKRVDKALGIKRLVENNDKKATLFALKEIIPEALMQFPTIDAFINTACPRLSLDDAERFRRPMLTPRETLVLLGLLRWEELCSEGWFEN